MKLETKWAGLGLGAALVVANGGAEAAKAAPASLQEMWKIIQQQQKEIEVLKAKAEENAALKQQVKELQGEATEEASAKSASGAAASAKLHAPKSEAERKTDILASEVEKLKTQLFIPEKREYKSEYGFGPAASQVYRVKSGLSIGGYGEAIYTNYTDNKGSKKDNADALRAVIYAGYKFNDWIILNNEFEFEHGTTKNGTGEVSVEFSQLDFLLHRNANIRAGLMLMPMGFINEIHEPVTFHGNYRPDVERFIIPTTWRELGAGLFGEVVPGLDYRMYAVNGLDAKGFTSGGIRDGRQSGAKATAENWAFTGRLDYSPDFAPGVIMGTSAYLGDSGQDRVYAGQKPGVFTQLYEGHIQWHYRGLEMRALGAYGNIDNANLVSAQNKTTVGGQNYGWYTEAAYDVMPLILPHSTQYLAPFFRYERYNTQYSVPQGFKADKSWDRWIYQAGLTYKPIPNISVKADYRNIDAAGGDLPDEFNLGVGFIY